MQKAKLPLTIDIIPATQKRLNYAAVYTAAQVTRLAKSVISVNSDVSATLSCVVNNQELPKISSQANVKVTLLCQRCNQPFEHKIQTTFTFSPFISNKQPHVFQKTHEASYFTDFCKLDLLEIIEDEIIISLPISPMHGFDQCEVSATEQVFGIIPAEVEKTNPFSMLVSLKYK
ncbi:MAG: YceD family protein [Sodalis sp. (in: enterobacteria)]